MQYYLCSIYELLMLTVQEVIVDFEFYSIGISHISCLAKTANLKTQTNSSAASAVGVSLMSRDCVHNWFYFMYC